ncbi:indolepyruvate oxidoreductase subunit beta [Alloiococcus sp. CFN-8]|uniref:indolepyruvate oxidoreductase subunit beta n=1 Tax=Alloiococcus sp. CFN-8 TaxID=3416081 RepID=UPI003CECCEE4
MATTNILICGVGGQGLVLSTTIISEVCFIEGYDLKTSDVIGLSQRGGKVWGHVRFGEKVYSASIPQGEADYILALEQLEGLRWLPMLRPEGKVILSEEIIYPNRVLLEKEEYPQDIKETMKSKGYQVYDVNSKEACRALGNIKASNTYLLGVLSTFLPFKEESWLEAIKTTVSPKILPVNLAAFKAGRGVYTLTQASN